MALFRQPFNSLRRCLTWTINNTKIEEVRTIKRWVAPTLRELERRRQRAGPRPLQPRSTYLEWNYDAEIYAFAKRLGEEFEEDVLRRAFTHRSYVVQQEMKGGSTDMAVLQDNTDLIEEGSRFIEDCLSNRFKEKPLLEEVIASLKKYLMMQSMLAHVATHMGIEDLIRSVDFPAEETTIANTFKAVVAALRQSRGDKVAAKFVDDFLVCQLNGKDEYELWNLKNPYEYLLRLLKDEGYPEVEPRLCNQSATNTILANYQVGLYSHKKLLGIGWGESVEVAKDTAALDAIKNIQQKKK